MNIIDKIIDSRSIPDQSIIRPEQSIFNLPDFRNWPDSIINSSSNIFAGNMFPITPSQLSRSLKISPSNNIEINQGEIDKNSEEEDFCDKCQKKFCNKYYLKRHKIDVHKLEFDLENSLENFSLLNDTQHKPPLFRPSLFNPLFNPSFSNFLLQKSMAPIFANILMPQSPLSQLPPLNSEFNTSSSSILPQSGFRSSQSGSLLNSVDLLTSCHNSFPNISLSEHENKIPNLTTSIYNEVQNSFIKLPSESKSFLNLSMLDNGFRDPNRNISQNITCTICGMQLSGGETVLLDHLYTCHNNEKSSNMSPTSKNSPIKDSPMSPVTNGESYISPFDAFKSSMAAAKLADRVTCDICHKDLCNKYFLRTHKLKLHGIQTMDSNGRSGNRKDKTGLYERCPPQFEHLNPSPNFITSSFSRSSLPDPVLPASLFPNSTRPTPLSPENGCFCPICKRLVSLPYFLPLHMWNVHGVGMGNPNSFLPPVSVAKPNIDTTSMDHGFFPLGIPSKMNQTLFPLPFGSNGMDSSSIGSKWYRKSPNQMRVRCDICDKWICNKYFLRTHKLNKHGLTDSGSNTDVNSDSVSRGFFVDSTNALSTSSVNIDSLVGQNNIPNTLAYCENSPIDLSASPTRENCENKTLNVNELEINKKTLPSFSCNSILSNVNLKSMWNTGIGLQWPLRFSFDRIDNSSLSINNNTNNSIPLDLSIKPHKEDNTIRPEYETAVRKSLIISTAKKLKIKYQKIYRSKLCQRISNPTQKNSSFIISSSCSSRINECFSCPLCGKELSDAPRFLHHLTQFHDMVLPGNHSGTTVSSNSF